MAAESLLASFVRLLLCFNTEITAHWDPNSCHNTLNCNQSDGVIPQQAIFDSNAVYTSLYHNRFMTNPKAFDMLNFKMWQMEILVLQYSETAAYFHFRVLKSLVCRLDHKFATISSYKLQVPCNIN